MNQILYINNENNKKEKNQLNNIFKFFAISIILFGICLIAQAVIPMFNKTKEEENPVVQVQRDANDLVLTIKHTKLIDKITYNWENQSKDIILQGKGRKQIEEKIEIPIGINTLYLNVLDIDGKNVSYTNTFERDEEDTIKPEIEFLVENSKVKIIAKDETKLKYIIYYWNNEDETKVPVREESLKQIEDKISILKGENKLTIIAVDEAGNETIKEQIFKGATKPTIDIIKEDNGFYIEVSDEEGIEKIEYNYNGETDSTDSTKPLNSRKCAFRVEFTSDINKITVKAYNISGLVTEVTGEANI